MGPINCAPNPNAGQLGLESSRPGSTRPGQISAWSSIKPTFSMLGNVFNKKFVQKKLERGEMMCHLFYSVPCPWNPQGGGGYSDISIHTWSRVIFWGSKLRVSIFLGVFRKNNIFMGLKISIFLGGSLQNWTFLCISQGQGTELGILFGVAKISNIF